MQSKNFDKHQNESASMASRISTDNVPISNFSMSVPFLLGKNKEKSNKTVKEKKKNEFN